jgi:hypothetical protein
MLFLRFINSRSVLNAGLGMMYGAKIRKDAPAISGAFSARFVNAKGAHRAPLLLT